MKPALVPGAKPNLMEMMTEYTLWGGSELFQAFLGCLWISFMLSFIFFFLYYNKVYNLGVKQGDKSYYLS